MNLRLLPLCLLSLVCLCACDDDDAVSIRIRLRDDGSGTLTTSGITVPTDATRVEGSTKGVEYGKRVLVSAATGRFAALTGVNVADIVFTAGEGEGGFRYLNVTIPQGQAAKWMDAFMPLDERTRLDAAAALDPSGKSKDVGANLKIQIEMPAVIVSDGATGKVRGTKNSEEGSTATLVVPIQGSRAATEPLVWHITWQK